MGKDIDEFLHQLALAVLCSGAVGFGLAKISEPDKPGREQPHSLGRVKPVNETQQLAQPGKPAYICGKIAIPQSPQMEGIRTEDSVFGILYHSFTIAKHANPQKLRELSTEALNDADPLYSYNVASIFIEKMVADDPYLAMTFVETLPNEVQRVSMVSHVLTSWVRYNEDEALTYFRGIADMQLKSELGARFLMDKSLSASFIAAITGELGPLADSLQESIRLRNTPVEDLFAQALTKQGEGRNQQLRTAAWRWFSKDQESALQAISNLPTASERNAMTQYLLSAYITRDPKRTMELLEGFAADNNTVRRAVLAAYASNAPAQAVAEVERYISETPDSRLMSDLLASWVNKDPEAAIQYAEGLPVEDQRKANAKMVNRYIANEPKAGLEWAVSLGDELTNVRSVIPRNINEENLDVAESLIFNTGVSQTRTALITGVSRQKAKNDPESTLDWLGQFEGEAGHQQAYSQTLRTWSREDPEGAAYHIEQQQESAELTGAFGDVARSWYTKDKNAALDWVNSLPDTMGKHTAVAGLIASTARGDNKLAMELFESLPEGDLRDRAGLALLGSMTKYDKKSAEAAIEKLGLSHLMNAALLEAISNSR